MAKKHDLSNLKDLPPLYGFRYEVSKYDNEYDRWSYYHKQCNIKREYIFRALYKHLEFRWFKGCRKYHSVSGFKLIYRSVSTTVVSNKPIIVQFDDYTI